MGAGDVRNEYAETQQKEETPVIPQPYPLYVRTWIKGDTAIYTAAIIGWEAPDTTSAPTPVVAFLHSDDYSEPLATLDHDYCWHVTTDPDDEWEPEARSHKAASLVQKGR